MDATGNKPLSDDPPPLCLDAFKKPLTNEDYTGNSWLNAPNSSHSDTDQEDPLLSTIPSTIQALISGPAPAFPDLEFSAEDHATFREELKTLSERTSFSPEEIRSGKIALSLSSSLQRLSHSKPSFPDVEALQKASQIILYPLLLAKEAQERSSTPPKEVCVPTLTKQAVSNLLEGGSFSPVVTKTLGRGGQSPVEEIEYKGRQYARKTTVSPKEVALSLLYPHPNLIHTELISPTEGAIFPRADGTLKELTQTNMPTPRAFTTYLLDICKALDHMHKNQLIHRDIKASNMLVKGSQAFVADLGLSCFSRDLITCSFPDGTVTHLAPELLAPTLIHGAFIEGKLDESHSYLTEKMDVFSFGVMLHELLTGNPWIYGEGVRKTAEGICSYLANHGDIVFDQIRVAVESSPLAKRLDPTRFWIKIMGQCLQLQPSRRPSMEEIIRQISSGTK